MSNRKGNTVKSARNFRLLTICITLSLFITTHLFADVEKVPKFGKDYKDDLNKNAYEEAPDEDAIILQDVANMEISLTGNGYNLSMKHHVRIKILTEEGKEAG